MKKYPIFTMLPAISAWLIIIFVTSGVNCQPDGTHPASFGIKKKLFGEDTDGGRRKIVVIGDGYTIDQENDFDNDVKALIGDMDNAYSTSGLFKNDIFNKYKDVFSAFSLFVPSKDEGITTSFRTKDTALGIIHTGEWGRCYLEEYKPVNSTLPPIQLSPAFSDTRSTDERLQQLLMAHNLLPYHYLLIIANYPNDDAGCSRGNRIYITKAVSWELLSHEFGHAIGNLYDEYWNNPSIYSGQGIINARNCSIYRDNLPWKQFLTSGVSIPTILQDGDDPSGLIGAFKGCNYHSDNIYRPSFMCRMRNPKEEFCPVCVRLLEEDLSSYRTISSSGISAENANNQFLNVDVRITRDGLAEIISATGFSSNIKPKTTATSKFIYEVRRDGKTDAVGVLPEDPFIIRAISNRDKERGEIVGFSNSTTVSIDIPNTSITDLPKDKLSVRFYEIEANKTGMPINNITPAALETLKNRKQLERFSEITNKELKSIILIKP